MALQPPCPTSTQNFQTIRLWPSSTLSIFPSPLSSSLVLALPFSPLPRKVLLCAIRQAQDMVYGQPSLQWSDCVHFFFFYRSRLCELVRSAVHFGAGGNGISRYFSTRSNDQIAKIASPGKHHPLLWAKCRQRYWQPIDAQTHFFVVCSINWTIYSYCKSSSVPFHLRADDAGACSSGALLF